MKVVRTSFQIFKLKITFEKKKAKRSKFVFLKRRGKEEVRKDPQLSGQWKVPRLMVLGKNPMFKG
jgi:hypothetical protein